MFGHTRVWCRFLALLPLVLGMTLTADAGWVTLKNDSNRILMVQEAVVAQDGTVRRGKPTRLLPGETLREFQAGPVVKRIEVYEPQTPARPLFVGRLNFRDDNQVFSISSDGKSAAVVPIVAKDTVPVKLPGPKKS